MLQQTGSWDLIQTDVSSDSLVTFRTVFIRVCSFPRSEHVTSFLLGAMRICKQLQSSFSGLPYSPLSTQMHYGNTFPEASVLEALLVPPG